MRKHPIPMLLLITMPAFVAAAEPAQQPAQPQTRKETKKAEAAAQDDASKAAKPQGDVAMSGMSILGNDEAPKSLVIVPWKSSQLGNTPGIARLLDDATQPVDKEVFMRELTYYEIKQGSK